MLPTLNPDELPPKPPSLTCIEVGGSGVQTVTFEGDCVRYFNGVNAESASKVALAVPGIVREGRYVSASNLGWRDTDITAELNLETVPNLICNDAEAAAIGEWVLRDKPPGGVVLISLGTGVGGAVVPAEGKAASNLFGHQGEYSAIRCRCGEIGCLETVAAGWAVAALIDDPALKAMAAAIAKAVEREPAADGIDLVVATGGIVDNNPLLVEQVAEALPRRTIVTSARPAAAKSAAPWGLLHLIGGVA